MVLNLFGKKPWEVPHLDTLELWKFGDYKTYTSLKLLTNVLGIPSPKDDIDGSEVYRVYYEENDIDRIITYCEKDTVAVAQVFLRLRGDELLHENEIKPQNLLFASASFLSTLSLISLSRLSTRSKSALRLLPFTITSPEISNFLGPTRQMVTSSSEPI